MLWCAPNRLAILPSVLKVCRAWLSHGACGLAKFSCALGSQTYVILTMTGIAAEAAVLNILNAAANYMEESIRQYGDIVIPGGGVEYNSITGVSFSSSNSNNHQQTYGVLAAAIEALKDYMGRNYYGKATFYIFDGISEVGLGKVG